MKKKQFDYFDGKEINTLAEGVDGVKHIKLVENEFVHVEYEDGTVQLFKSTNFSIKILNDESNKSK